MYYIDKQGWIHGNPVADGWAVAVMQKPLAIQKCYGRTDRRTDRWTDTARCRVACPRLKTDTMASKNRFKEWKSGKESERERRKETKRKKNVAKS